MKRKTFVRMLMGAGMSRNNANEVAKLAHESGRAYFRVLDDLLCFHWHKFKMRFILDDMKVRTAVVHGTLTPVYRMLYSYFDEFGVLQCKENGM